MLHKLEILEGLTETKHCQKLLVMRFNTKEIQFSPPFLQNTAFGFHNFACKSLNVAGKIQEEKTMQDTLLHTHTHTLKTRILKPVK
jgi:hypothetical protein